MYPQTPSNADKLCPSCGRQWPHTAFRCTCGHQFTTVFQAPVDPNAGQTQQFMPQQPAPIQQTQQVPPQHMHPQQQFQQQPYMHPQQPVAIMVSCPRCRIQVWSTYVACPNCGNDLQTKPADKYLIAGMWSGIALPIAIGMAFHGSGAGAGLSALAILGGFIVAIILVCRSNRVERTNGAIYLGLFVLFMLAAIGNRR